ncbi:MAG: STAS domain-containing protein [Steroidobacteraceae bacterium]|nr:STAS domain-containing protein [Steroidobacteraceae bacterium]
MDAATLSARGDGGFALAGDLVFDTVPALLAAGEAAFGMRDQVHVDLAGVGRVDSAGLALLLEWSISRRAAGCAVAYRNVPPALRSLAAISEVEGLLAEAGTG